MKYFDHSLLPATKMKQSIIFDSNEFKNVEEFICSVIFIQVFPIAVPLIAEYLHSNEIKRNSYDLCLSIYFFSSGIVTSKRSVFSLCFLLGVIIAFSYGTNSNESAIPIFRNWETYFFLVVSFFQILERWNRHVNCKESFFNLN